MIRRGFCRRNRRRSAAAPTSHKPAHITTIAPTTSRHGPCASLHHKLVRSVAFHDSRPWTSIPRFAGQPISLNTATQEYVDKNQAGKIHEPCITSRIQDQRKPSAEIFRDVDQRRTAQWNPTTGMADLDRLGYGDPPRSENCGDGTGERQHDRTARCTAYTARESEGIPYPGILMYAPE